LPGASEDQIAACESELGVSLPEDVKASFRIHNGQQGGSQGIFPPPRPKSYDISQNLLTLQGVLDEWSVWKDLIDGGEFEGESSQPDDGIRDDWWRPGWISLTYDGGGDSQCVDLEPAAGGVVGQVIGMNHETGHRPRLACSWLERLQQIADGLDRGELVASEKGEIIWAPTQET
jgi:cell wall assembly regulator SMI1